jgi:hypothetical protein
MPHAPLCPPPAGSSKDPAYVVESPVCGRWFEAKHDAWWEIVEVHLEALTATTTTTGASAISVREGG